MSRFNLIDEPWISVVINYKGTTKLVGLKEFFENAHTYIALAGDMPTQDFAVMRFILAILHTVFSRYDAQGNAYEVVTLNDRMQQLEEVDQGDYEDYEEKCKIYRHKLVRQSISLFRHGENWDNEHHAITAVYILSKFFKKMQ